MSNKANKGVGLVFTHSPAMAGRDPITVTSAEEVIERFGNLSKESEIASKFFDLKEKSASVKMGLKFASWGYAGTEPWKAYTASGSAATGFVFTNVKTSASQTYDSIQSALTAIGSRVTVNLTLTGDVLYITSNTKEDTERYNALVSTCGETNLNVTTDANKLNGFQVGEKQIVTIDLKGHKMCGDTNVIRNKGLLTINDSVGTGCVFTTNFDAKIGEADHSSRFEHTDTVNRATTEAVRNEGSLIINGGWFGTDRATAEPWINEVNWGQCLACHGDSATVVNGGHFTTVAWHTGATDILPGLASEIGQTSWLASREYPKEDFKYSPYAAIVDTYDTAQVQINVGTHTHGSAGVDYGPTFYGLYNDVFEVEGPGTTSTNFGGVQIYGGKYYIGFPGFEYVPLVKFGMMSMLQASAPTANYYPEELPLPTDPDFEGYSPIVVYGGAFYENISVYTKTGSPARNEKAGRAYPPDSRNFTGRVSIKGGMFNFSYSSKFEAFEQEYEFRGIKDIEEGTQASSKITDVDAMLDDSTKADTFGVFCIAEGESNEEASHFVSKLQTDKYQHIYIMNGVEGVSGDAAMTTDSLPIAVGEVCRAFIPVGQS